MTVSLAEVQNLVASWWFDYDQANFDSWPGYFTADARFSCRSDSGRTDFEDFIRADLSGRDEVLAWQVQHRRDSPYPLRHNGTNVHITGTADDSASFRSYIAVSQVVGGFPAPLASGYCLGRVSYEQGVLRFAQMQVVLDFTESGIYSAMDPFPLY